MNHKLETKAGKKAEKFLEMMEKDIIGAVEKAQKKEEVPPKEVLPAAPPPEISPPLPEEEFPEVEVVKEEEEFPEVEVVKEEEEFPEVEVVKEEELPELQNLKRILDEAEEWFRASFPLEFLLKYFKDYLTYLSKDDPFYKKKKEILEKRIDITKEKIEARNREGSEMVEKAIKEVEEKNRKEEIERRAKEISEKMEQGIEPYTKEMIEKILKEAGITPQTSEAEAFLKDWQRKEAERLIKIEKEEKKKKEKQLLKLKEARERLVAAEKSMREFEGLVGAFRGFIKKVEKISIEEEYEDAKRKYEEARAEFVGGEVGRMLKERAELADLRARELYRERGRLYKFWKKLGELNLAAAYKKIFGREIEIESRLWRFGAKMVSVRAVISALLLGLSFWAGAGTIAGLGAFLARRGFAGLGAGIGSYDLLKLGTEKWAVTKGWRAEISDEELEKMSLKEIEERMAHFEVNAPLSGKKVSENKTYLKLQERYEELKKVEVKDKADRMAEILKDSMAKTDQKLKDLAEKSKRNERIIKAIAVGMGLIAGSGVISKLISGKWSWERFARVGAIESEIAVKAPPEVSLGEAQNQLRLPEDFVSQMAGRDGKLTNQEFASLVGLEKCLVDVGLEPSAEEVVKGLGVNNIEDIDQAESLLESLRKVTSDSDIIKTVAEKGLQVGDAENLEALIKQIEAVPVEFQKDVVKAVISNNFENQQDFINILKNVDSEHLSIAGVLKEGELNIDKLKEIANARTITIDRKGQGLYTTLRDLYTTAVEKGGFGMTGREARAKIFEQFRNPVLLKEGKVQDLLEIGDQIKVDSKGNVLLYIAEDGKMGRRADILSIVGDNDIKSGGQVFDIKEGIEVRAVTNPLDGHTVIKITDLEGVTHRIADWSTGKTAFVDGKKVILEDWLREKGLLTERRPWVPEKLEDLKEWPEQAAQLEEFKETQRYFMDEQREYLSDLGRQKEAAIAAGNEEMAAQISKKIEAVEDAIGQMKKVTLQEQITAAHGRLNKILAQFDIPPVEEFPKMSKEELSHVIKELKETLKNTPTELSNEAERIRQNIASVHDYAEGLKTGDIPKEELIPEELKRVIEENPEWADWAYGMAKISKPISFDYGMGKVIFGYDELGNVEGFMYRTGFKRLGKELLRENYLKIIYDKFEKEIYQPGEPHPEFVVEVVEDTAGEVETLDEIHQVLIEKGMSKEDDYIRESIMMAIERVEKKFGIDVFK